MLKIIEKYKFTLTGWSCLAVTCHLRCSLPRWPESFTSDYGNVVGGTDAWNINNRTKQADPGEENPPAVRIRGLLIFVRRSAATELSMPPDLYTCTDVAGLAVRLVSRTDHEPGYTPPPPQPRGILPHGNFWVPSPSKYTVQVVCKWAVAVCVCGAGSNKCTKWNSKLRWPCLLATHLLWQKRPFPYIVLLFEQFNML